MCSDKNVLKVRIYGAEYPVRGYADANYIKEVADYVDRKMRDVDKNIRVDSSLRVAILASLNITDEMFKEKKQNALLRQQLEEKLSSYSFFRTHRSFLVNMNYMLELIPWFNGTYNLVLNDEKKTKIPVSRSAAKELLQRLQG